MDPIENINESEKTWPGLNVSKVLGQVGAGGTEADDTNVQSNSNLFVCTRENGAYKKKMDRVQDPQNTIETVKRISFEKIKTSEVARFTLKDEPYNGA